MGIQALYPLSCLMLTRERVIKKKKKISSWTSSSKRVVGGKYHVISHGNPGKAENHTSKIAEIEEAPRSYSWSPSFLHLPVSLFLS